MGQADSRDDWVRQALGADPRASAASKEPASGGGPKPPPPNPTPAKPPRRGRLSQAEYDAWLKAHPKAKQARYGPWMPDAMYKVYTSEYMKSKGFFLSGKMRMGSSGEYDEVWLNDRGDGVEVRVYRGVEQPKAPPSPEKATYDPDENAEDDVIEAEGLLKDLDAEGAKVKGMLRDLVSKMGTPEFEGLRKAYIDAEAKWQQNLQDGRDRIDELLKDSPSEDSKPELEAVQKQLADEAAAFPYGPEWGGRPDIPYHRGDPIHVKPPASVTGDHPITF
jgi:hypothetical protein